MYVQKRKRRDYRNSRKAQFTRPEPGFSLYEGRTRGKRIRYNYSDEEEVGSDAASTRRSNRQSGLSTPAELAGPMFTASGRQVRSRVGGAYGQTMLSGSGQQDHGPAACMGEVVEDGNGQSLSRTRTRGSGIHPVKNGRGGSHIDGYNALDEMEDESDATSSGGGWDGGDDDEVDAHIVDDDEEEVEDDDMTDSGPSADEEGDDLVSKQSLVVSLRYQKHHGVSDLDESTTNQNQTKSNGFSGAIAPSNDIYPQNPNLMKDPGVISSHHFSSNNQTPLNANYTHLKDSQPVASMTFPSQ